MMTETEAGAGMSEAELRESYDAAHNALVRIAKAIGYDEPLFLMVMGKEGETYADTLVRLVTEALASKEAPHA